MPERFQLRRDTAANWTLVDPVLASGEVGVELDNDGRFKIGDGILTWSQLGYFETSDAVATAHVAVTDPHPQYLQLDDLDFRGLKDLPYIDGREIFTRARLDSEIDDLALPDEWVIAEDGIVAPGGKNSDNQMVANWEIATGTEGLDAGSTIFRTRRLNSSTATDDSSTWAYGGAIAATPALNSPLHVTAPAFVTPGDTGNDLSTPDVNLFDADIAHLATALPFTAGTGSSGITIITDPDEIWGPTALEVTTNGLATTSRVRLDDNLRTPTAAVGQTFTILAEVSTETPGREVALVVHEMSAADSEISSQSSTSVSLGAATPGSVLLAFTFTTAAALVARLEFSLVYNDDQATPAVLPASETWLVHGLCVRSGSTQVFARSHRIIGDLELTVVAQAADWTPNTTMEIVSRWATECYSARLTDLGRLQLAWHDGSVVQTRTSSQSLPSNIDFGDRLGLRFSLDVSASGNNETKFYYSTDYDLDTESGTWTQLGSTQTTAGVTQIQTGPAPLTIGRAYGALAGWRGAIYRAWISQGLDNIVASMDPVDHLDGATPGDNVFSSFDTGETWTLVRAGTAGADITHVPNWTSFGDSFISIPNRAALNVDDEDFFVAIGFSTRATTNGTLVSKRDDDSPNIGWELNARTGAMTADDGPNVVTAEITTKDYNDGSFHQLFARRDVGGITISDELNVSGSISDAVLTSLDTTTQMTLFTRETNTGTITPGRIAWIVWGTGALTSTQQGQLRAFTGEFGTEPSWLLDKAVFYANAGATGQESAYRTSNEVLNNATNPQPPQEISLTWNVSLDTASVLHFHAMMDELNPTTTSTFKFYVDGVEQLSATRTGLDEASFSDEGPFVLNEGTRALSWVISEADAGNTLQTVRLGLANMQIEPGTEPSSSDIYIDDRSGRLFVYEGGEFRSVDGDGVDRFAVPASSADATQPNSMALGPFAQSTHSGATAIGPSAESYGPDTITLGTGEDVVVYGGIIMKSPDGELWRVTVTNAGTLLVTAVV